MAKRPPRHKVNHKQRAKAISALSRIVESPTAAEYVVAKAASALLGAAKADDDALPERDPTPAETVFFPGRSRCRDSGKGRARMTSTPAQREGRGPARRYCASIGEPYNPTRALPHIRSHSGGVRIPIWKTSSTAWRTSGKRKRSSVKGSRSNLRARRCRKPLGPRADHSNIDVFMISPRRQAAPTDRWKAEVEAAGTMIHRIRLNQIGPSIYACTGAVSIARTTTPVPDVAAALRRAGHPDTDLIAVDCGNVSILPATIGRILNFPHTGRRQEYLRDLVGVSPSTR